MIVIGTAGHIDHGKSAIVKRLTGTDPDRLPEEKARGMTIDLGFAFYRTRGGDDIALVDVPGHERFVKNMIAGAGAVDAVMLVVAADDGWMPQSQEHFQIARLLGVRSGLIVINKVDLADPDWLELLEEEIREKVADSFLADAPLFRVSAETGEGFGALVDFLDGFPRTIATREDYSKARLYIDRSFIRPGIGGVVTGTLRGGSLSLGQTVSVWPAMVRGKVRTLQSRNEGVTDAAPGQRTAVSLTGVDRELLVRGGVISDRDDLSFFDKRPVLALSIHILPESRISLADRRRALMIVGTTEMEGEVRLLAQTEIPAGEAGIVFFKPDRPVYTLVWDHFIFRLPTPMVTLGGGLVLDHLERLPRRKLVKSFAYLERRVSSNVDDLVVSELEKRCLVTVDLLLTEADVSPAAVERSVGRLVDEGILARFEDLVYHKESLARVVKRVGKSVSEELDGKPHLRGLPLERIGALASLPRDMTHAVVRCMLADGALIKVGDEYNLAGRTMALKGRIKEAYKKIMADLTASPYAPPALSHLAGGGKDYQQAIKYILDLGEGYKLGSDFILLSSVWRETVQFIRERIQRQDRLLVADLRDRFGFTRKYAIPILEETDRLQLTRRDGDVRVRGAKFESEVFNP